MASIISAGTTSGTALNMAGDTSGVLELATNGSTTAVTIDTSQKVGIGTTSPNTKLHVVASGTGNCARLESASGPNLAFAGTEASGRTYLIGEGLVTAGNFSIYDNNAAAERLIVDSSGNVLMQTTTPTSASNVGASIQPTTNSRAILYLGTSSTATNLLTSFRNPNGQVGTITVSASATTYNTSSDYRLKENIAPMTGALDKVALLKPVTYKWKVDGSNGQGFIAHELQEVVPECVSGEKDGVDAEGNPEYQGVDTSFLVATLTAAIQEQQTIINDLKARITALEGAA
jgi:hypothetical protein